MAPHAVEARHLTRRFRDAVAIRDVSLIIPPSSVVLITGANGAGKTTLLRVLATALRPSSGQAAVFGHDLERHPAAVRALTALATATPGLYGRLTARENLRFAARMSGRPDYAADLLARVGLTHVADRPVSTFSLGMKRRLALARAWLLEPRLLLFDEPFAGLDAEGNRLVDAFVTEVKRAGGAVLLATHDRERGAALADRTITMEDGRIA